MEERNTIVGHLLEYTLREHFNGNKSQLANSMGVSSSEVYRFFRRFTGGGSSFVAAERILLLYQREGFSLDKAIAGYDGALYQEKPVGAVNNWCVNDVFVHQVALDYQNLRATKAAHDAKFSVAAHGNEFMKQLERIFCRDVKRGGDCFFCAKDDLECPCKMFAEFLLYLDKLQG